MATVRRRATRMPMKPLLREAQSWTLYPAMPPESVVAALPVRARACVTAVDDAPGRSFTAIWPPNPNKPNPPWNPPVGGVGPAEPVGPVLAVGPCGPVGPFEPVAPFELVEPGSRRRSMPSRLGLWTYATLP